MPQNRVAHPHLPTALLLPLLLVGLLTGCAVTPTQDDDEVLAPVPSAELNRATALATQGKATEAAEIYRRLASQSTPPARAQLQLKAARTELSAGRTAQAAKTIDSIEEGALTTNQREQWLLAKADVSLLAGRPKETIDYIKRMQVKSLPTDLRRKQLGTLAAAQRQTNSPAAAAETLNELDRLLDRADERLANQVSLISTLSAMSKGDLQALANRASGTMKGWVNLALLAQQSGTDTAGFEGGYRQWRRNHMLHPALPNLAQTYAGSLAGGYTAGSQVTVMLPRSGRFAAAADAVRKGIEAANQAATIGARPTLDFADSTNASRAKKIHAKATQRGADYVIGPLEKPAVDQLVAGRTLSVPTLALNEATRDDQRTGNLFQFSLSPENEAAEAANKAFAMGLKRALLVYPEGDWGIRLTRAFERQWRKLGGSLVGQVRYNPASTTEDTTLTKQLQATNADLVFLVATVETARQLHPKVRSVVTHPTTVISTSHVYSGDFDAKRDAGLVGLYFVDIPWMLDVSGTGPLSRHSLGSGADPLARLRAMGIDAYRLAPRLTSLGQHPGAYFAGQTGGLSIDASGRVRRQLELGRFTETGPRPADGTDDGRRSASN
jgi:uncharacterized protein